MTITQRDIFYTFPWEMMPFVLLVGIVYLFEKFKVKKNSRQRK
jgi:hypothetical protein